MASRSRRDLNSAEALTNGVVCLRYALRR